MLTLRYILCMFFILSLSGCIIMTPKEKAFYDDHFIASEGDSFTYFTRNGSFDHFAFSDFSGTETVCTMVGTQTVTVEINYQISKGLFKFVLISPAKEITILEQGTHTLILDEGSYRIKIVGSHAFGKLGIYVNEQNA
jgi:hypothetical protein